ncbi:MAG: hypothetical protein OXC57_05255 [Rhodobacteraceae bacterium]|nr:hypothetical protein [Paracoccaceae bacterium]
MARRCTALAHGNGIRSGGDLIVMAGWLDTTVHDRILPRHDHGGFIRPGSDPDICDISGSHQTGLFRSGGKLQTCVVKYIILKANEPSGRMKGEGNGRKNRHREALLDRIGRIQKDWDKREARLTGLLQNLNTNMKVLSGNQRILNAQLKGLEGQIRSLQELPGQLERLDRQSRDV